MTMTRSQVLGHSLPDARVTLLTRTACHLCAPARLVVADVCEVAGEQWVEVNVDSDPELCSEYGDQVPVVLVDGDLVATLSVEPGSIQRALND